MQRAYRRQKSTETVTLCDKCGGLFYKGHIHEYTPEHGLLKGEYPINICTACTKYVFKKEGRDGGEHTDKPGRSDKRDSNI